MPFGTITSYFYSLARGFVDAGYYVVIVIDNSPMVLPEDEQDLIFRKWPSHRPTSLKHFSFFMKMLEEFKPRCACLILDPQTLFL